MSTLTDITNALRAAGLDAVEGWDAVFALTEESHILAEVTLVGGRVLVARGTVDGSADAAARTVKALAAFGATMA